MEYLKCIVLVLLSLLCCYGVNGNVCDGLAPGDYCSGSGYISCPSPTVRPCRAGLVCSQYSERVVYCVRPSELVRPGTDDETPEPTSAPTAAPTPAPTAAPTPAPTRAPTAAPTVAPPPLPQATTRPTPASTPAPTSAPTAAPTPAPTAAPTRAPTSAPTSAPSSPTTAPAPSSGRWPYGNPVKAIYIDNFCWGPSFSFNTLVDNGYNLIILAFIVNTVPMDCAIAWEWMSEAQQLAAISYAHSKGGRIIVSTGGATDSPYNLIGGAAYARAAAQWAKNNHLDGIDFDLENFGRGFTFAGMDAEAVLTWVVDATNTARTILGTDAIITHAPQPPYFGNYGWANGYGIIYQRAPHIDFFLVQFYNNGPTNTYETMFLSNSNGGSVTQMAALGIPMSKIVIGKPVNTNDIGDLSQGYNTGAELKAIFARAKAELGWNAGVMGWQWVSSESGSAWINSIYPK